VFVRELMPDEAVKLRRIARRSKVFALRQRAQIVLASDAKSSAPEIARVLQTDENQVRRVIREFNADGMGSLRPRIGGGRPRRIDDAAREEIRAIALARPRDLGEPGTRWSLATLRRYLIRNRVVDHIDREHLRRILRSLGITAQRTRTWKWSSDPLFEAKKGWVLAAYKGAEAGTLDGVVVSFDECGPISLKPHAGRGWFAKGRPGRQRATYNRHHGVRKLLGAYDVGADRLWGHLEKRRVTAKVVLEYLKDIRRRYPADTTVYIVMDNLWPSLYANTTYLLSVDYAEPGAPRTVGSTDELWRNMIRPLRAIDGTRAEYSDLAQRAAGRQHVIAGLADIYRWSARLGIVPAMAGVVLALATRTGRKHWRTALVGAVLLVAVGSRIAVLTLVDATAFGAHPWPGCVDSCTMQFGIYQLSATGFLVGFLVIGWWLLATFVAEHVRTRHVAADVLQSKGHTDMAEDTAWVADSSREPLHR
jgi:transposase